MPSPIQQDFKSYLSSSLNGQFLVSLREASLLSVVEACATAKSRIRPKFKDSFRCLIYNLRALEDECQVQLMPIQVTDVFWGYFISFCQLRKLAASTIQTLVNQLRSVLTWAVKYGALVSPTYTDIRLHKTQSHEIALTADEVSRVAYFDVQRFYADRRPAYRATMERVRDMFVLSCNLGQRHSDMVRIEPSCFERNMFRITQQKTGNLAVVNIDDPWAATTTSTCMPSSGTSALTMWSVSRKSGAAGWWWRTFRSGSSCPRIPPGGPSPR